MGPRKIVRKKQNITQQIYKSNFWDLKVKIVRRRFVLSLTVFKITSSENYDFCASSPNYGWWVCKSWKKSSQNLAKVHMRFRTTEQKYNMRSAHKFNYMCKKHYLEVQHEIFNMGIQWPVYVTEQVIKSVNQINTIEINVHTSRYCGLRLTLC